VHVSRLAADEGFIDFDFAADFAAISACNGSRRRDSMNRGFLFTSRARASSYELVPFFQLTMSQSVGRHFWSGSGESSKMVPTLSET
jgi:hypothetical protein